ncbi:MAG TPA: hypothetical protein VFG47_03465 [Geminicoccaceae bacterium]|nr:hypothetical protein [Geminicoccaceae bacterium]
MSANGGPSLPVEVRRQYTMDARAARVGRPIRPVALDEAPAFRAG